MSTANNIVPESVNLPEKLFSEADIQKRVATMAGDIARDMPGDTIVISLLKGAFVFTADLIRAMHNAGMQPQVDFVAISSYGSETSSSGTTELLQDIRENIQGKHVLIVDDILESGRTLSHAERLAQEHGAADVKIAVLLEKPGKIKTDINADFTGFVVPDKFVVGYGLDHANCYRELPFIGWLEDI